MMFRFLLLVVCLLVMACDVPAEQGSASALQESEAVAGKADDGNIADQVAATDELEEGAAEEEILAEETPVGEETLVEEGEVDESHPLIWDGEDVCETAGLYDDEDCHDFCPKVDPVCPPPEAMIEPEPIDCSSELPVCEEGQAMIDTDQNECMDTCVEAGVGCAVNSDCVGEDEYCARELGDCGATVGTCTVKPDCEFDPLTWTPDLVCGCDGYVHASPCDAAYVGINLAYEGMCEDE